MMQVSIRRKLTLWYGGVLAAVLCLFGVVVFLVMQSQMLQRIDQGLHEELADVLYEINRATDEEGLLGWLNRRFSRHEGFDFQITRRDGRRFFVNDRLMNSALPIPKAGLDEATAVLRSVPLDHAGKWRIVNVTTPGPSGPLLVQVARSLATFDQQSSELLYTFLLTGPMTLAIAVCGGYFLARQALTPVLKMAQAANQITADKLHERIDVAVPNDELGFLAKTLNRMIERLEQSFAEIRRFTADAAHELRTPLAVIRNEAEVALRALRTPEEYVRVLEELLDETIGLSNLADQLLFLSRQDAGIQPAKNEIIDVDALLRQVVANMQLVAECKGLTLSLNSAPGQTVTADGAQLCRVFYNLLDNAIKYTPPQGQIKVMSTANGSGVEITVEDNGIGIVPEHCAHIFERFYRVDAARPEGGGAGLGLAICRSIVRSLGGSIELQSLIGQGTRVTILIHK